MTKILPAIFLMIFCQQTVVSGQVAGNYTHDKVSFVSDIMNEMRIMSSSDKIIWTGFINTTHRKVTVAQGFAYNGLLFAPPAPDSLLLQQLKNKYNGQNYLFEELSKISVTRNDLIKSSSYFNRDSCASCTKLYFEVGAPLEGWEQLEIFYHRKDPVMSDSIFFEKYYTNQLSIPVFMYSEIRGKAVKDSYLFCYELTGVNAFKLAKKIRIE